MPDDFPFDVFLSDSSHDKSIVRPLAERLRQDGLRVWFDEWGLRPGDWMSLRSNTRGSSSLSHIRRPTLWIENMLRALHQAVINPPTTLRKVTRPKTSGGIVSTHRSLNESSHKRQKSDTT